MSSLSYTKTWDLLLLVLCLLFLPFTAHAQVDAELAIGTVSGTVGSSVSVPVTLTVGEAQSATIIFRVGFDPASVQYLGFTSGAAAIAAGKDVNDNEVTAGSAKFIIESVSDEPIGTGVLVWIQFKVLAGADDIIVLTGSEESAADPEGNRTSADILDGAITLCDGPVAPETVTASEGRNDGVLVSWTASSGAATYRVYRSATNNSANAVPMTGWISGLSYLDTVAAPPTTSGGGCAGPEQVTIYNYYYWVRARDASLCAGVFSQPAQGHRGEGKALEQTVGKAYEVVLEAGHTSEEVWLPVPEGLFARDVEALFYEERPDGRGWWRAADDIDGLVVPNSHTVERVDGIDYVVFEVRKGGTVQLGLKPELVSGASALPNGAADAAVMLAVAAVFILAGRARSRRA